MSTNSFSQTEWEAHLKAFKVSKLSRKAYCRKNNLLYHRFQYYYRHHYLKHSRSKKQRDAETEKASTFVPVTMKPHLSPSAHLELKFPNGIDCRLPLSIEPPLLKSLIEILRS